MSEIQNMVDEYDETHKEILRYFPDNIKNIDLKQITDQIIEESIEEYLNSMSKYGKMGIIKEIKLRIINYIIDELTIGFFETCSDYFTDEEGINTVKIYTD